MEPGNAVALSSRGDAKRMCPRLVVCRWFVGAGGWWLVVVVFVGGDVQFGLLALEIIIMVYVYVIYTCIYRVSLLLCQHF